MADITAIKLLDNNVYNLKDSRVAVPVPANAVFTDHIFSGLAEDVNYDNTDSDLTATSVQDAIDELMEVKPIKPLWIDFGTITSLPITKSVPMSQADMICTKAELGTRSAKIGRWSVNTENAGEITISGTISGSTTLKILLEQVNIVTIP